MVGREDGVRGVTGHDLCHFMLLQVALYVMGYGEIMICMWTIYYK